MFWATAMRSGDIIPDASTSSVFRLAESAAEIRFTSQRQSSRKLPYPEHVRQAACTPLSQQSIFQEQ